MDAELGLRVLGLHPSSHTREWREYLNNAEDAYRQFGVEGALSRASLEPAGCDLFWLVLRGDTVAAGLRAHGPHARVDDYRAPIEMGGTRAADTLREMLAARLGDGVVEIKGVFVATNVPHNRRSGLSATLARCHQHSVRWLRAEHGLSTAHRRLVHVWIAHGGQIAPDTVWAPYPDDRYETTYLWWNPSALETVDRAVRHRLVEEQRALEESSRAIERYSIEVEHGD